MSGPDRREFGQAPAGLRRASNGAFKIEGGLINHDDLPFYSIEYRGNENEIFSFRFCFSQEAGGTIFFPNQREMRWHRTPDGEVPWAALR
jgi:hypothetical protein